MKTLQPIATPAGVFTHENIQRAEHLTDMLTVADISSKELICDPGDTLQYIAQSIAWFVKDLELETAFHTYKIETDEIGTDKIQRLDKIEKLYTTARLSLYVLDSRIARYNDPKDDAGNEFQQESRKAITMCTISEINLFISRMVTIGRLLNFDFLMLLEQELNK